MLIFHNVSIFTVWIQLNLLRILNKAITTSLYLQVWRRQGHRRTPFFFAWGLTSVLFCYMVFQCLVVAFREVLLWEILLQLSSTAFLLYMLYQVKKNPGRLRSGDGARNSALLKRSTSTGT